MAFGHNKNRRNVRGRLRGRIPPRRLPQAGGRFIRGTYDDDFWISPNAMARSARGRGRRMTRPARGRGGRFKRRRGY